MASEALRVVLDANILLSYLLTSGDGSAVGRAVRAGFLGRYTLLLPRGLLEEIVYAANRRPYLSQRINPGELRDFVGLLTRLGEAIAPAGERIPMATRDVRDDYLLAAAVAGRADFLVTGDRDLLVLGRVADVTIVTVQAFCDILAKHTQPASADA